MLLDGLQLYVAEAPLCNMMKTLSIMHPTDDVFALALGCISRRLTPVGDQDSMTIEGSLFQTFGEYRGHIIASYLLCFLRVLASQCDARLSRNLYQVYQLESRVGYAC